MQTTVNSVYLISIISGGQEQHWQTACASLRELGESALKLARDLPEYSAMEIDLVTTKTIAGEEQPPVTQNIFSWKSDSALNLESAIGVTFLSS